jgi:hypothetical protein
MSITHPDLEEICRNLASEKIELLQRIEFTVGEGEDGQISGASFCWWMLKDQS